METQYISLNMTPTGVNPCFHISQYDVGRMLGFIVHSGGVTVDLDTYTCTIEATRSDGTAITSAVATTDNIGTFEVTPTMSNKTDKYRCQLVIVDANSKRIASLPFDMDVCKAAMDENSESIEEDASLYQQYTKAVQGAIAEANADIQAEENARIAAVTNEKNERIAAVNAEATARQIADDTLQGNINSETSARASADSNLQSQINQIVAPSGEAPSAAEVQNARIGADGVTYDTLGNAIRGQVTDLKSHLGEIDDVVYTKEDITNLMTTETNRIISDTDLRIAADAASSIAYVPIVDSNFAGKKYIIKSDIPLTIMGIAVFSGFPSYHVYGTKGKVKSVSSASLTELSVIAESTSTFLVVTYNTADEAHIKIYRADDNIDTINDDIDALDERINIIEGDNLYTGAETWSGTWINGSLWTTSQETYKGMPVKQRAGSWSGIHHAVNVEAGKHYHFTAYYKCTSAVGIQLALTQVASTASVYMWDEKGYAQTQNTTIDDTLNRADKWRKINLEFDCTASGTIHPVIQAIESTTLYVCGYEIVEGYNGERPVYNCLKDGSGDFDALAEAVRFACMFFDATVYVGSGEWDVISELGSTYMESVSPSKRGLYLKNRIRLVFSSNSKVVANYEGSRTDTMLWFAPFNSARYGFSLENVNIECSNVRYAVHDERNAEDDEYTNYYLNCKMKLDNTNNSGTTAHQCIGGGLGLNGHIVIDGGDYQSIFPSHKPASGYRPISYHNSAGAGKSRIDIKNVYIHDGGIRLNWYGQSTEVTECYVTGCSFTSAILSSAETSDSPNQNISVTAWNNELRT